MSDTIEFIDLPADQEEAFLLYERHIHKEMDERAGNDLDCETDQNGNYVGDYAPQRDYVTAILAFFDEYDIEQSLLKNIALLENPDFPREFRNFQAQVTYIRSRYHLRTKRSKLGRAGTPVVISASYKDQITGLIDTIQKIVEAEIQEAEKKEAIYKRLSALRDEVLRDRTTLDAIFSKLLRTSEVIGGCAENIDPLIDKLERLKQLFFDGVKEQKQLDGPKELKKLPAPEDGLLSEDDSLDEDIPF